MEAAAKTAENYQAQVDRKERELAAGLCTETDLLQAQKNLLSAQTALQSTTDQANKALRQLAILLGKSGTSITLGEIPAVSATELSSMNLDADRAAAVIASSSVKSARRSSATGDAARKLRHQQIEEAESAASASADEQYAEIAALSLERDAAQAAYQSAEKTYGATQIKYQSGAINKATYMTRSFWRRFRSEENPDIHGTVQAILNERESLLNEAVMQLPLKQRVVIHLHYYEDYSIKEIADILRLTESSVKMRLMRGRENLRKALKEESINERQRFL